jgi:hypothetical protein
VGRRAGATVRQAARGEWRSVLARTGLAARGVLYVIVGVLAIQVARGDAPPEEATRQGAVEQLTQDTGGRWLILALTVGLFALAAWRFIQAATGDPVEGDEGPTRLKFAARGVLYVILAVSTAAILESNWTKRSGGGGGEQAEQQKATRAVLDWPAGWLIVIAVGLGFIGYGGYQLYRHGAKATFMERLNRAQMGRPTERAVETFGRAGYAARSIVFAMVGVFLVVAGATHDPGESKGLSGVLQELSERSYGRSLLWAVAAGLILFGLFNLAEARYRRAA